MRTKKIEDVGLDNNGVLKILSTQQYEYEQEGKKYKRIYIKVKLLKKVYSSEDDYCHIIITYYDPEGNESHTQRGTCCGYSDYERNVYTNMKFPGEIGWCSFSYPDNKPYKISLYGGQSQKDTSDENKLVKPEQTKKRLIKMR
jgi:hypothetical protein